jgi:hypothetical protein
VTSERASSVAAESRDRATRDGLPVDPAVDELLERVRSAVQTLVHAPSVGVAGSPNVAGKVTASDVSGASIDLLVDRHRVEAERERDRISAVETRSAAIATVAVGLGTVVITQADAFAGSASFAYSALVLLMLTVLLSVLGRVVPRVGWRRSRTSADSRSPSAGAFAWLRQSARTPSQRQADEAAEVLTMVELAISHSPGSPRPDDEGLVARMALLAYWRARACSDHHAYNAKARWVVAAAVALIAAVILLGVCGITLIHAAATARPPT